MPTYVEHLISHAVWRRGLPLLAILLAWLCLASGTVHANRLGPPWQARVSVDQTTVYAQPDRGSSPVGPLVRGQIVVVVGETPAADGSAWTHIPDGYLPSTDVTEEVAPWVAEVVVPSVSVYARPSANEVIRRTAKQGDLLRVTGISPGIEGDTNTWWATTEGYVALHTLQEATSDWARSWQMPSADAALNGWWGAIRSEANVRAAPTTQAPIVGRLVPGDRVKVLAEEPGEAVGGSATWYQIDGGRYAGGRVHSSLVTRLREPVPTVAPRPSDAPPGPWIVVSRSAAVLSLLDQDGQPRFTTLVSLGRAGVETPEGDYATLGKYRFDTMSSATVADAEHEYHLPNVPFVEYYRDGGYAIHGTYWHDHFGAVESQGCINLTWTDAAYLFAETQPTVADGDLARWAINVPATPVVIVN